MPHYCNEHGEYVPDASCPKCNRRERNETNRGIRDLRTKLREAQDRLGAESQSFRQDTLILWRQREEAKAERDRLIASEASANRRYGRLWESSKSILSRCKAERDAAIERGEFLFDEAIRQVRGWRAAYQAAHERADGAEALVAALRMRLQQNIGYIEHDKKGHARGLACPGCVAEADTHAILDLTAPAEAQKEVK